MVAGYAVEAGEDRVDEVDGLGWDETGPWALINCSRKTQVYGSEVIARLKKKGQNVRIGVY